MLTVRELQEMPHRELKMLHANAAVALTIVTQRERATVKAKLEEAAKAAGFTVKELLRSPLQTRRPPSGKPVGPKYVNPKAPDETWTGRGRRPAWLAARLKAGQPLERFLSA